MVYLLLEKPECYIGSPALSMVHYILALLSLSSTLISKEGLNLTKKTHETHQTHSRKSRLVGSKMYFYCPQL